MNRAIVLPNHRDPDVALHYWPGLIRLQKPEGPPMYQDFVQFHLPGLPQSWRFPIIAFLAMALLATLDFAGAIFAKEWIDRGHTLLLVGGLASFSILFIVYARILAVAELSIVTLGWVVLLQIAVLALDRIHYGVTLPWQKWAAIVVILILQTYLLTGSSLQRKSVEAETGGIKTASLQTFNQPLPQ